MKIIQATLDEFGFKLYPLVSARYILNEIPRYTRQHTLSYFGIDVGKRRPKPLNRI